MEHSVKTLKPSTFQAVTLPVRDEHSWASDAGSQLQAARIGRGQAPPAVADRPRRTCHMPAGPGGLCPSQMPVDFPH
jgi:hypothetical protein